MPLLKSKLSCYALSMSLLLQAALLQAATPTQPLRIPDSAAPTFSVYSSRDGLSDEIWSTVGFDRNGFVWGGSASELARFDGYRWVAEALPVGRSLVRDMASDTDGNLWAIFESEGLARYDGHGWTLVGEPRFYQRFSTVLVEGREQLWASHDNGLARLDDGVWIEDAGNGSIPPGRTVAVSHTQTLFGSPRDWLGDADNGVWFREATHPPGPWQRFEDPLVHDMPITDLMRSVADDGAEELWVLSYGGGVARIRKDGARVWRADAGELPTEAIYSVVETHSASGEHWIWMASRAGLLRFRDDRFDVFNRRNGLPSDAVRGLKVQRGTDGIDTLWLATEGGVARATLSDSPWQTVSLLGANENGTFTVMLEPNDRGGERLWVGSAKQGLALLDAGQWRYFTEANGALPARSIRGLWRLAGADGRDHRLLSIFDAPLLEIGDDLKIRPLPTPWPTNNQEAAHTMLARSVGGSVEWWAGTTRSGVFRLRNGRWTQYPTLGDAPVSQVNWLAEQIDAGGRSWLWAAQSDGLARFDGERWQRLPDRLYRHASGFRSLTLTAAAGRQVLWASSAHHGIVRLDVTAPDDPSLLTDKRVPDPPDPVIYSVLPDSTGRLYVCTNNGVQQLTPQADGSYSERVFHRRDGLVHDECNTNSQLVDGHDRYWVGTLGGLSVFDPGIQPPSAAEVVRPKPLYVTELRVDGEHRSLVPDAAVVLQAGSRELRIEYSLLTGLRETESRYRTRLIGYEADPTEWTAEHARSVSNLAPGDYQFRIEARDFSGTPATPLTLRFTVSPLWWQRPWLQALLLIAALLIMVALVLSYNRGLRRRQRQLRQEVAERTDDLRSANRRLTELSYMDPLTGIANRRRLLEAMRVAMERAHSLSKPLGLIVADVDHFKDYNDRYGHLTGDIALRAIADAMQTAVREQDLVARFGGEEFACLMIDADLAAVMRVAERMRALVAALPPRSLGNDNQGMSISAGILSCVPAMEQSPEDLLDIADQALYQAKAAGRNRVHQATRHSSDPS